MKSSRNLNTIRKLVAAMILVAITICAVVLTLLYRTAYQETLNEMDSSASFIASQMEAVARFDKQFSAHTHPQGAWGATLSQIEQGILLSKVKPHEAEIIIGLKENGMLQILRAETGYGLHEVARLPLGSPLAIPLQRALQQQTGSAELPDYKGENVLAGYAPVPSLQIGIVYKRDLQAVREPFLHAIGWSAFFVLILTGLGALLLRHLAQPLLTRSEQSEQRFASLLSAAPVGVYETDPVGKCVFVNDRWCELTGLSSEQALEDGWLQALHPADVPRIFSAWQAFVEEGIPFALQYRFQRPDGALRWVSGQAAALRNHDGQVTGYTGTISDITDYVLSQEALQENEARLNEAQHLARVGSWELDLRSNALTWSDEVFHIFEIDKEKFAASYEAFLQAIHPEDRDAVNAAYTNSLSTRMPYTITHRLRMEDGRIKWVQERCETLFDTQGTPLRSSGTVQDITELKQAEMELSLYRDHLEQLVSQRTAQLEEAQHIAKLGHWHLDIASGKLIWSDEIYRIFGHAPQAFEPSYTRFFEAVHPDDVASVRASEQRAFSTDQQHSIDHRILLPNGEIRWVHEEAQAILDATGQAISMSGTVQDITERKQIEEKLISAKEDAERANAAKSEFLSRMSHELRTPMNAILGFAQVLQIEVHSIEQQTYVTEILRAGDHLLELINELLDLSRIETGTSAAIIEPMALAPILASAVHAATPLIQQRDISVIDKCNHAHSDITVLTDSTRLRQILFNLISNAAKYNRQGGSIRIDCRPQDESHWRLSITDTGPGISQEKQHLLFKPFERLGAQYTEVEGAGIGLALSKKLAELMGAEMGVSSTPGQGSTFWIDLPRTQAPPPLPGGTASAMAPFPQSTQHKLLYIEDNAANLKVVEAMLRHETGITLISATSGIYGLELAQRYHPDMILLDIHLPGMNGFDVLSALQNDARTRDIPVVALSADALPLDVEQGLKAGFVRYLTKPVKAEDLKNTIREVMLTPQGQS